MITRQDLKRLADELQAPVSDLLALAPPNDPFYQDTPGNRRNAQWFAHLWERFDYDQGIHLRRIHYQAISQDPPLEKPNGTLYENTTADWAFIQRASKAARYLGYVDPAAFVDRRNPDPHIVRWYGRLDQEPQLEIEGEWTFDFDIPTFPDPPRLTLLDYHAEQPYHLEVWAEKTTMDDILLPICHQYDVNLITGKGELSITAVVEFLHRANRAGRPAHIFYIADFDPAGHAMPVSIARKIEYLIHTQGIDRHITLHPLALTKAQVVDLKLPRTPIKPSDRRRPGFEDTFGKGAVELDALEALHPGRLSTILIDAILQYYDTGLESKLRQARRDLDRDLQNDQQDALGELKRDLQNLEARFDEITDQYQEDLEDLQKDLEQIKGQMLTRLHQVSQAFDLSQYPIPEGKEATPTPNRLYNSARTYRHQLRFYHAYRNGRKPS
jgi:hypothetical protein